jgi:hypothetical protein
MMSTGDVAVLFVVYTLCMPVPMLALFGVIRQRKRLKQERINWATAKRISGGWRRR